MPIVIGHDPNPGALLALQEQMGLQEQFNNQQSRDLRAVQEASQINATNDAAAEHQREFDITSQANQSAQAANQNFEQQKLGIEAAQAQQRAGGPQSPTVKAALAALESAHNDGSLPDDAYAAAKVNLLAGKRVTSAGDATADQRADSADARNQQAIATARDSMMNKEIAQGHQSASDEVKAAQAAVKGTIPYTQQWYSAQNALQAAYGKLAGVGDSVKAKYNQPATGAPATQPAAVNSSNVSAATGGAPPGSAAGGSAAPAPSLKPIPRSIMSQLIGQNANDPAAAKAAATQQGYDVNNIVPG
jgi:hypothetical protein